MNRILVIDDDLDLCELLGKYLEREGFEFDTRVITHVCVGLGRERNP